MLQQVPELKGFWYLFLSSARAGLSALRYTPGSKAEFLPYRVTPGRKIKSKRTEKRGLKPQTLCLFYWCG